MVRLFVKVYGCQMNNYDAQRTIEALQSQIKIELIDRPRDAEIILLITCSVREKAQEKLFSDLGRFRRLKKDNQYPIIAVGGCVASQLGSDILKRIYFVDIIFGPQTIHRFSDLYRERLVSGKPQIDISFSAIEKFDNLPPRTASQIKANITIMEGCNNFCSYCIVPYTRGREVSRSVANILCEIKELVKIGTEKIVLLGQNVNNYLGFDDESGQYFKLSQLIERIAEFENIKAIGFITSNPRSFDDDLIEIYARIPKLVSHLHLPLQSGADKILKLMRRGYNVKDYINIVEKLRQVRPNIKISTDFIVGFPNESDEDFQQTLDLVHKIKFTKSYSFIYSKRPGTVAARMDDNLLLKIKKERLQILQRALKKSASSL